MSELKYKDTEKYYWCAWGDSACHWGKLEEGHRVSSGQPNLENYETEAELEAKVDSLKGSGYYADSKEDKR